MLLMLSLWRLRQVRLHTKRQTRLLSVVVTDGAATPDSSLVDSRNAPHDFDPKSAVVYRDFITSNDQEALVNDIAARMKRRRYEKGHWDAVITDYKEVELVDPEMLRVESRDVMAKVRRHLMDAQYVDRQTVQWLPCHAIDLRHDGQLKAHVDSIKFSGDVVAGLSLLSSSIMRLKPDHNNNDDESTCTVHEENGWVDLYLPPLSLYVLSGISRYNYSHELRPSGSVFGTPDGRMTINVKRDRRLSVIFRDVNKQ